MLTVQCPRCGGAGAGFAFSDGPDGGSLREIQCEFCNGTTKVTPDMVVAFRRGRAAAKARVVRGEAMGECAKRLGVNVVALSHFEQGRIGKLTAEELARIEGSHHA